MAVGPFEFLLLLFCCGIFIIPVALVVYLLIRQSNKPGSPSISIGTPPSQSTPYRAAPTAGPVGVSTLDSNDRILAGLGYVIWIVALVVVLLEETKRKPLLKDHAVQALAFAVASFVFEMIAGVVYTCASFVSFGILSLILWPIFFVPLIIGAYYGYLAYTQDELVEIPFPTDFVAQQGWLETRKAV